MKAIERIMPDSAQNSRGPRIVPISGAGSAAQFADFDKIEIGNEAQFSKTIGAEDVENFARLSGDRNPLHVDEEFARRTRFGRPVVHGMLVASYVSTLVGMHCPGPGALWGQQSFRWLAPVFVGDRIQLQLRVTHKSTGARSLTLAVTAINQNGKVIMEGEGVVTVLEERSVAKEVQISERVAFVSDSSNAIGAAVAATLARAGAAVVINYRDTAVVAEELCAAIESTGGRAIAVQADTSDRDSVVSAVRAGSAKFNRPVDLLVNSAGCIPEPRPFMETNWNDVQSAIDIHLCSAFQCCQAVIPGMSERKSGRIVNIGSSFAMGTPPPNWSSFLMAKSAMQALTRSLAVELGPLGIRVNMVSPGLMETDAMAGFSERLRKVQAMQTPLRRIATPDEVAAVVIALCSGAGDFITGTEIPVCGGLQMQ